MAGHEVAGRGVQLRHSTAGGGNGGKWTSVGGGRQPRHQAKAGREAIGTLKSCLSSAALACPQPLAQLWRRLPHSNYLRVEGIAAVGQHVIHGLFGQALPVVLG